MDIHQFFRRFAGRRLLKRTLAMIIAVIFMGIGVGFFMLAAMGSDPFSTLNLGVSSKLGLSFGVWQAIFNIILLALVALVDRSKLGLGTIGNMFLVGFACGASFGIGTLIMAFGTGPILPLLNQYVSEPLLRAKEYKTVQNE